MKISFPLCGLCLLLPALSASATPVLTVGTPANDQLSSPSKVSPNLGGTLISFDNLTPYLSYTSAYIVGQTSISSPDGLTVLPFSGQSAPNELYDTSADGSVNLTISVLDGTRAIGFGVEDSDGSILSVQAFGVGGGLLGPDFLINLATIENTDPTGQGYYVISDSTSDIYALAITAASNPSYSGLALDDVQIAPTPEPASLSLLGTGLVSIVCMAYTRRRAERT